MIIPPIILPIYGSLAIHAYGLFIAIGVATLLYNVHKDFIIKKHLTDNHISQALYITTLSTLFGGRFLYMIGQQDVTRLTDFLYFFKEGYSILGAILSGTLGLTLYLYSIHKPVLSLLDRVVLYVPLAQSIGRLGCFFQGCCYGAPTSLTWLSTVYTSPHHLAPLHVHLHPAQLYSSFFLFCIFIFLWYIQKNAKTPGQILCIYGILMSIERFSIDFVRYDQEYIWGSLFSLQQWIALGICIGSLVSLFLVSRSKQ